MPLSRLDLTYRVQNVPKQLDEESFGQILGQALNVNSRSITVLSLASLPYVEERKSTKFATVMFKVIPAALDNDEKEWAPFSTTFGGLRYHFEIDIHFLGFTPLNDVDPREHILT